MKLIMATILFVSCTNLQAQVSAIGGNLGQAVPVQQSNANTVYIEQVGSYNTTIINQDGLGHYASVVTGKTSAVDNTYVNITQQGTGAKAVIIENPSGYNNSITTFQDGAGNHTQSGGTGADKTFNLYLNGSTNATVQVEQTNPNSAGQAGMAINCGSSCGTQPWSYISR